MANCTLANNIVRGGDGNTGPGSSGGDARGGGISNRGTMTLFNCTISANEAWAAQGCGAGAFGGGFYQIPASQNYTTQSSVASLRNTIIAGNIVAAGPQQALGHDAFGAFNSQGFNLIGKRDDSSGWIASDQTGTKAVPLNPRLGALANNGGPTPTMALLLNSPALDKGKSFGLTTDQRGAGFIRPADASALLNAVGGDGSDIGAFELQGPFLSINDVSISEGNSGTRSAAFTVSLSPASGHTVTVKYFTSNGSATAGSVYVAASLTTLTFAPGETAKTVGVTINGDTAVEANETFFLSLSTATNATLVDNQGRGTILNDDGPTLSIRDAAVNEGNSGTKTLNFAVQLSTVSTQTVTVKYATANDNATAGSDYVAPLLTTISFVPGETSKAVGVTVNGDTAIEANETFFVNLTYATNATIFDDQAVGTISNDDGTVSASTKTNTNDSFSGIGAQTPVMSSTIISPESTSSARSPSVEPAPPGTTESQLITIVANASLSTLVLTFADTVPGTFTVTVNGEPVAGQTSVKGTSVTISLPQDILNSDDNVVVLWDNGMAEAVAS